MPSSVRPAWMRTSAIRLPLVAVIGVYAFLRLGEDLKRFIVAVVDD